MNGICEERVTAPPSYMGPADSAAAAHRFTPTPLPSGPIKAIPAESAEVADVTIHGAHASLTGAGTARPHFAQRISKTRGRAVRRGVPAPMGPEQLQADLNSVDAPHGDTFQLYLREIGQAKLLTVEEEVALAERIQGGDKDAREQMIKANLRLVVKIARDYEGLGLPLLDLVSEGNIGLMKGVERFRPTRGAKLSTYVAWWIKQSIKRALAHQSKIIRLPVHVTQKLAHMRRASVRLREFLDREATDQELADDLELSPRRIRQYRDASRALIHLDSPISSEDATPLAETLADENAAAPFDGLVRDNDHDLVHEVLATLDRRESRILAMRFGLDDGRTKTLEQVAERFGVTRERIRQIQDQALDKMRERIAERDPF